MIYKEMYYLLPVDAVKYLFWIV